MAAEPLQIGRSDACQIVLQDTYASQMHARVFPKDGDWRWDPTRFPQGEAPIEEYVHQSGMKLGLWMAWTHGGYSIEPHNPHDPRSCVLGYRAC